MKFSTKAEYGLKAMVNLAAAFPVQKNLQTIAREEKISVKYLERIIGELRKNKMLTSSKGKAGGYILAKNPKQITTGEIVEILDGPIAPTKCALCGIENKCSSSLVWIKLGQEIKKTLDNIKLSDLI
ncbi:MAG: Rrf2 family transcriptional regulator [Parcubacteria group bacterium]|jgi:Rrf2 family cysteine metabolism transcriptional repressor